MRIQQIIAQGSTSVRAQFFWPLQPSGTDVGYNGLTITGMTASYFRDGDTAATSITLSTATIGTWASGAFGAITGSPSTGLYEFGIPNAVFSSTARNVMVHLYESSYSTSVQLNFQIVPADPYTGYTVAGYATGQDPYTSVMKTVDTVDAATNADTLEKRIRLFASALLAKVSGMGTNAPIFRNVTDTKARITATTDSSGNRSAVTLDGS